MARLFVLSCVTAVSLLFPDLISAVPPSEPVVLTTKNYEERTKGKTVFVLFFSPKCEKCRSFAPTWEKLTDEWDNHPIGLIGAVDCGGAGKDICARENIGPLPSLKYGNPDGLEFYGGGPELEELRGFARENLVEFCSVDSIRIKNCTGEETALIAKFQAMTKKELDDEIKSMEETIESAKSRFTTEAEKLNEFYIDLLEAKEKVVAGTESNGLSLMKEIRETAVSDHRP